LRFITNYVELVIKIIKWQITTKLVAYISRIRNRKSRLGNYLFIYLTFANTDNKNVVYVRTSDCRTTRQDNCTYRSPIKHTNINITMNIILFEP